MKNVTEESNLVGSPNSDGIEAAEERAVECFIALERAELKFGLPFGRAMIDLRNKKRVEGERWMAYLKQLGIKYDVANKWMNQVKGKETRHGKKAKAKTEPTKAEPSRNAMSNWERVADEFKVLVDHALILKNSQPVSEPFKTRLASLAKTTLRLTEGGDNA